MTSREFLINATVLGLYSEELKRGIEKQERICLIVKVDQKDLWPEPTQIKEHPVWPELCLLLYQYPHPVYTDV